MELDNETIKQISEIDDRIDNQTSPKYKSVGEALQGIGTTVAGMASGAVSATLGLPTDIIATGVGIKEAILADKGERMDAFGKGFTEVSKENMGSEYYKENFNQLLDSLIENPVLKQDSKSGFSAGEFGGVGGIIAKAPTIARGIIAQKETAREILSSLGLSSKAMKNINVDNMSVDAAINLAKKLKVARAKLYGSDERGNIGNAAMAMTAKREPSPVRKMTEAEKRAQEFDFEKSFDLPIAKARGQMEMGIQKIAERIKNVSANIEKTGYYDAYPKGSKFVGPRSGKEYTVIGYSVSPVNPKGKDTLTKLHNKRKELIESGVMPKELTFFDGNNPKFSANVDEYDDKFYRPMLVVKDKDGKTERFNYDILLHQDERKKELLNKVMPTSNAPKVNILDSTKEGGKQKSGLMSMTTKREPSPVREMTKLEQVISDVPKADADKLDDIDLYKFMENFGSKYDDFDLALEQSKLPKEQLNKAEIDFGNRMSNIDKIYRKRREKNLAKYKELDKHAESADYEFTEAMDSAYDNAADTVDETAEEIFGRTMSKEELLPLKERGNLIFDNYFFSSLDSMLADMNLMEDYNFFRNLDNVVDKNRGGLMARN